MGEVWQRILQVLSEPVAAFRALRERPLILWALIIVVASEIAMNLLAVEPDPAGTLGFREASPADDTSAVQVILEPLLAAGAFWVATLVFHYVARMFGGSGTHRALLSTMGFAAFPGVFQAPAYLVSKAVGVLSLAVVGQVVFAIWMIVLNVLAIRETEQLSTGRSVGVFILGIAVAFVVVVVAIALIGIFLAWLAAIIS